MKTTPKDFFLWAGAMISLYVSVVSFIALMFEYINRAFPDVLEANYYTDPYSGAIRFAIASLLVFFPLFLALMRIIRKDIAAVPEKADLWIRRWALHLTLFIAGLTIAIDLVTLVNTYLGGDISARFGVKVLIVLLVALGGFLHFLADLRGYWTLEPKRARMMGWAVAVLILVSMASGILIMGTPSEVRLYRFDSEKVSDLQNIQWQVVNYYQAHEALPPTLLDLNDSITGYSIPVDPQTGESYVYEIVSGGGISFKLCADFNAQTQGANTGVERPVTGVYGKDLMSDSWWHGEGETCFTRTIDPELYPTNKSLIR